MSVRWIYHLIAVAVAVATSTQLVHANWTLESSESLGTTDGIRHLKKTIFSNKKKVILHLAVFDSKTHDILVIDDAQKHLANLDAAMQVSNSIAGVNGGYFHPDHRPLGLVISDGEVIHPQERAKLLSGILAANRSSIYLLRPSEFKYGKNTRQVLQSGPFLVDNAKPTTGLNRRKRARRSVVASDGKTQWALINSSAITLQELGEILADRSLIADFPIQRALNLDGGSSSAFWFKRDGNRPYYSRELTHVRNYLGVTKRIP